MTVALPHLISVIVPVYNGESSLSACLRAIFASDYPDYEVIVVDDLSSDRSIAIAEQFPCTLIKSRRRGGAANARNEGAKASRGEILFFTDSDVLIRPDTLTRIAREFLRDPECAAVFGSYTAETRPANFFSVYKNLMHHYTHQTAREIACTFWSGCGAIRSMDFWSLDGFDPTDTNSADVEDIALGYRLTKQDRKIRVAKDIQVTHTKAYSFVGLVKSDMLHRAVPWTKLMIRERILQNDLNTRWESFLSTALSFSIVAALFLHFFFTAGLPFSLLALALFLLVNRRFFGLTLDHGGVVLLLKAIPMTILFHFYSAAGCLMGALSVLAERRTAMEAAPSMNEKPTPSEHG